MTQSERNKIYVARCLFDGKMSISEAAEVLGLSERQVKRIKKEVKPPLVPRLDSSVKVFKKG